MDWIRLQQEAFRYYDTFSEWCFEHQTETDLIAGLAVFGSLGYLFWRKSRMRRRAHRLLWGAKMRRSRNRLACEKAGIAYAIEDHLFEQVYSGEMSEKSADEWRHSFASRYGMDELLPYKDQKTVKRSIRNRLNKGIHRIKSIIPGGPPSVKIDASYKPVLVETPVSRKSKYVTTS